MAVSSKLNTCTHYSNNSNNNNNDNNNTLKANPDNNTLKANPALCKHSTTTTVKANAQIMHKSDNNNNNNKDTSKMQYFAANA